MDESISIMDCSLIHIWKTTLVARVGNVIILWNFISDVATSLKVGQ